MLSHGKILQSVLKRKNNHENEVQLQSLQPLSLFWGERRMSSQERLIK
jgi:hypothetical protein